MEKIRCIYTSSVHSPVHSHHQIDLTPFDLRQLLCGCIQLGLLFRKPQNDAVAAVVRRLETSLAATLRFFPAYAGRLSRSDTGDGATAYFSIDCNNAGAKFVHAAADSVSVSDIADNVYCPEIIYSFFPDLGAVGHQGVSLPLMAAQVTELSDGVFVGLCGNHVVGDGASFWHFFESWSEISRGLETISKFPIQRGLEGFGPVPIRLEQLLAREEHAPPKWSERIYRYSRERVAELKAQANIEMGMNRISSLQAVLAHLWREIIRGRGQNDDEEVRFRLVIDTRPRWPLPEKYFGGAILGATVTMKAGDVLGQNGVGKAAGELNKIVALHTQQKLKGILESWVKNPIVDNLLDTMALHDIFTVNGSPRFNVYHDFGWGRAIAVRSGLRDKSIGTVSVYPAPNGEGGLEIHVCLVPQISSAM